MSKAVIITTVALGVAGIASAMIFGGSRPTSRKPLKQNGYTVGANCTLNVEDLETARETAYATGLAGPTHDEAVAKVFGGCGTQQKMQLRNFDDARHLFWLGYEVVRGSLAAGRIDPAVAQAQLASWRSALTAYGVDTLTLPSTF